MDKTEEAVRKIWNEGQGGKDWLQAFLVEAGLPPEWRIQPWVFLETRKNKK